MKEKTLSIFFSLRTLAILSLIFLGCTGGIEPSKPMGSKQESLGDFIEFNMAESGKPGLAVMVFNSQGPLWSGYYGHANIEQDIAVDHETSFSIASVTKLFVAIAALQLEEQGMLDLQADVNHYLDFSVRNPDYPHQPITVEMLLTHSAGIDMNFPRIWFTRTKGEYQGDIGEFCREYLVPGGKYYSGRSYADFAPGQGFVYSNVSVTLLAHIIETLSGQSLDDYCLQNIFHPMGMDHSGFRYSRFTQQNTALPYGQNIFGRLRSLGLYSFPTYPAGFGLSSVEDLSKIMLMFLNQGEWQGNQILTAESVERMLQVQPEIQPVYWDRMGLILQYKDLEEGYSLLGHSGGFQGISAYVYFDEQRDRGVAMTANGSWQSISYDRLTDPHMRAIFLRLMEEEF